MFDLLHVVEVTVSVKVYVVVVVGLTVGLACVLLNPDGLELHEYVLPLTALAPMLVLPPLQMVLALPALAAGSELTVTITVLLSLHPVAVTVSTTW